MTISIKNFLTFYIWEKHRAPVFPPVWVFFLHPSEICLYEFVRTSGTVRIARQKSRDMIKQTKWLCAQRILRSAWPSAQSDQSLHCALSGQLRTQTFFMRTAKTLIRLGGCPGCSEPSLGAHAILLVLSWGGSKIDGVFVSHHRRRFRLPSFAVVLYW